MCPQCERALHKKTPRLPRLCHDDVPKWADKLAMPSANTPRHWRALSPTISLRFNRWAAVPSQLALIACTVALLSVTASAQVYSLHNIDVSVGATEQFSTPVTTQAAEMYQSTTRSPGLLATVKVHPSSLIGFEANYQYSKFSLLYPSQNGGPEIEVPVRFQETTAAYLMHSHSEYFQPFVAFGAGVLFFDPRNGSGVRHQVNGLVNFGADFPLAGQHVGLTLQARTLYYRTPVLSGDNTATQRWSTSSEPSANFFVRF